MNVGAPFPYFGGKAKIAADVWTAIGQPAHYIEPFFGSGAVLLARPNYTATAHTETVCDKDGHLANGWRAETWKAQGGYANTASSESLGKENRQREMLYFSPHCLRAQERLL